MYKKIIKFILPVFILSLFCLPTSKAFAQRSVSITLDGKNIQTDVSPFIENNRVLVPIRFISEALNYKVDWKASQRLVTIYDNKKNIQLTIDTYQAMVNGNVVAMDVAPKIKESRTFVPLRFISESMGIDVGWDANTYTVILKTPKTNLLGIDTSSLTQEEIQYISSFAKTQEALSAITQDLKTSFFAQGDKLSKDQLESKYQEYSQEFHQILAQAKATPVPEKFKSSHDLFMHNISLLENIAQDFKKAFIYKDTKAATNSLHSLTEFSVKMTESLDALKAAAKGEVYKPRTEIDVYNKAKNPMETKNVLEDSTIKNLLNQL